MPQKIHPLDEARCIRVSIRFTQERFQSEWYRHYRAMFNDKLERGEAALAGIIHATGYFSAGCFTLARRASKVSSLPSLACASG